MGFLKRSARGLVWGLAGFATLLVGVAFLGSAGWGALTAAGRELGTTQREIWILLAKAILFSALTPTLVLTVLVWLPLTHFRPGLERGWRGLLVGIPVVAALAFVPVGEWVFTLWTPNTVFDYVATVFLIGGGVAIALWIPRRVVPGLGPGLLADQGHDGHG